jgi:uncharacterized protein
MKNCSERITSPCVSVCVMDPVAGVCVGCLRTLDEIAGWIDMSDHARRALIASLPQRRARLATTATAAQGETPHGER